MVRYRGPADTWTGTCIAIFLLQDLTFTIVVAEQVDGGQGRYFAPLALLYAVMMRVYVAPG